MKPHYQQIHHVDSTLKRRRNGRFHVVSTWNPRGVFVGYCGYYIDHYELLRNKYEQPGYFLNMFHIKSLRLQKVDSDSRYKLQNIVLLNSLFFPCIAFFFTHKCVRLFLKIMQDRVNKGFNNIHRKTFLRLEALYSNFLIPYLLLITLLAHTESKNNVFYV